MGGHWADGIDPQGSGKSELQQLRARIAELEAERAELVKSEERAICERDHWESKATELANDVGQALGFDVGEHSNMNCPVQTAIDGVYEMRSQIEEWQAIDAAREGE